MRSGVDYGTSVSCSLWMSEEVVTVLVGGCWPRMGRTYPFSVGSVRCIGRSGLD